MKYRYPIYVIIKNKMSQDTESMSISIIKKEEYPELLERITLFTKSENKIINRTVHNFKNLLIVAINEKNIEKYEYLKNGVEHALEYFSKELLDLANNYPKIRIELIHLELLNDISIALTQQLLFTKEVSQLAKFKQFLIRL
jgi:hypothetical protein